MTKNRTNAIHARVIKVCIILDGRIECLDDKLCGYSKVTVANPSSIKFATVARTLKILARPQTLIYFLTNQWLIFCWPKCLILHTPKWKYKCDFPFQFTMLSTPFHND